MPIMGGGLVGNLVGCDGRSYWDAPRTKDGSGADRRKAAREGRSDSEATDSLARRACPNNHSPHPTDDTHRYRRPRYLGGRQPRVPDRPAAPAAVGTPTPTAVGDAYR